MVSQYSPQRPTESGLSRTVFRLAIVFAVAFGLYYGYPALQERWSSWRSDAPQTNVLDEVKRRLEQGDASGAVSMLDKQLAEEKDPALRYALLRERVGVAREAGEWAIAGDLLKRALAEYPGSPDYPALAAEYGEALEKQERFEEARKQYQETIQTAPKGMQAPALLGLGRLAERDQELITARDYYRSAFLDAPVDSPQWKRALDEMGRLNVETIFSQAETPESKYYTIEPGDTLTDIGIKLNTTQGLLMRANGITDPSKLHTGQRLKYTPKDFRVLIERSSCRLFLMDNTGPFKCYPTGLGMPGYETALGKYTIGSKQKDPTWFRPNGAPVPPNDPENELGTRWMPMVPSEKGLPTDLGIHGTIAPETIGYYKSHGCPRLLNASAEELYDLIVRSTPVEVVETIDWSSVTPAAAPAAWP